MSVPAAKRQRFQRKVSERNDLLLELEGLYLGMDPSFIWDPTKSWLLVRPSRNPGHNTKRTYAYVGRRRAKNLFDKIISGERGQYMQVLGAKGSGKSTVACTIAGFLQGSKMRRVVYVHAKRFIEEPYGVLLEALLLSCQTEEESLGASATLADLEEWCADQPTGSLIFIVDDWDQLELEGNQELEKSIKRACFEHMLVKLSSVKSRTRSIWSTDDKVDEDIETFFFDGPFESSEMRTWIGQSSLTEGSLEHLDRLTGGIPLLLQFFEEVRGDEQAFVRKIKKTYTDKLHSKFIQQLPTYEHLIAAKNLLMTGELNHLLSGIDMTCFYRDDLDLYHPLSPYLRSRAEHYIMEQDASLRRLLQESDMHTWGAAVRLDLEHHVNPARVGWNIEGLAISVMRFRQKVFHFEFKHFRTYERGREKDALDILTVLELRAGVLLGPAAFNEKAVDVIYMKLEENVLLIKAIQITVAQWKAKAKKESHKVWALEVLPRWKPREPRWRSVNQEFYYVMPEKVVLEDVPNTQWKRFEDLDDILAEFDGLLLPEPAKRMKEIPTRCSGKTREGTGCRNQAYVKGEYFCARHHHQSGHL